VAKLLQGPEREAMRLLMMKLNKSITVRPQPQYHVEQYDLHGKWSRPELQQAQRGNLQRGRGPNGGGKGDRREPPSGRRDPDARPAQGGAEPAKVEVAAAEKGD
jgi:hypothetical protein